MRHLRQLSFIHYLGAALLLTAMLLCAGCAGGGSSTAPAVDAAGDSPPPRAIQGIGEKPVSVPDASPREGGVPLLVHFWDGGSYDPDGEIVGWTWNFGDSSGGDPGWHDYTATKGEAWHEYISPGIKVAQLAVWDIYGNFDQEFVKIDMRKNGNANPIAIASANPTSGNAPLKVDFSAAGSYDPDGSIVMYEWDFGAGGGFQPPSVNGAATYDYTAEGTYVAVLRVTDDDGAVSMDSVEITVTVPLVDDWRMFGHDPQHTRRSPFTGPTTNALKWTYVTNSYIWQASPAIGADGTVYVASGSVYYPYYRPGMLWAIRPDGTRKWSYAIGSGEDSTPAIGADGTIYVGGGSLFAINPDGSLKWSNTTVRYVKYSPVIGADGTIYVGSADRNLYGISPDDGSLKWSYTTGGYVDSSPAIGFDGTIYVGSNDSNLYAITPDGSLEWSYTTGGGVSSSPAIGVDGTIYVGSKDCKLHAVNPDGTQKWTYLTGNWIMSSSPAIGADGLIYVGSCDGNVYSINPDGTLNWSFAVGPGYPPEYSDWYKFGVVSSPAIGADGTVYIGSSEWLTEWGVFYAINPDGTLKWSYFRNDEVRSSPAIGVDGTVYLTGCAWGEIYAFGPGNGV